MAHNSRPFVIETLFETGVIVLVVMAAALSYHGFSVQNVGILWCLVAAGAVAETLRFILASVAATRRKRRRLKY